MRLVIHKNDKEKLVHISTHNEGQTTNNWSTAAYISKAKWAAANHRTAPSALHNFDAGFQCALILTGNNVNDWTDTVIDGVVDYRSERNELLRQYVDEQGYTNVGSSRTKTVRALFSGLVGNQGWGAKDYNPSRKIFDKAFKKVQVILANQGYEVTDAFLGKVYNDLTSTRKRTPDTKPDAINAILVHVGHPIRL